MAHRFIDGKHRWIFPWVIKLSFHVFFTVISLTSTEQKVFRAMTVALLYGSVFVLCMRLCHVALLKLSNHSMTAKYWANGGTPKSSILIYGIFHDKLTILGYLHLWKPPHVPFRNLFQVYALLISAGLLETSLFIDYFCYPTCLSKNVPCEKKWHCQDEIALIDHCAKLDVLIDAWKSACLAWIPGSSIAQMLHVWYIYQHLP